MKSAAALLSLLLSVAGTNAATTVLYQTDWEALPATPSWALGTINGQNSWHTDATDRNGTNGFLVVSNGSPGATVGGQSVVTPYGKQFVRVVADPITTTSRERFAWPDISSPVTNLSPSQKKIAASFDVFVPHTQTNDGSYYGIRAWHEVTSVPPWGLFIEPDDRSVNLLIGNSVAVYVGEIFSFDTWFNLKVTADYATGDLSVEMNGTALSLTGNSPGILSGHLHDIDLWSFNAALPLTARAVFMDNYRVTAEGEGSPQLTIQRGAIGEWRISWSATYFDWILESTQDISAPSWTNEGVTPYISGGIASVDLPNAPPRSFYRLRKP